MEDENRLIAQRKQKIQALRDAGMNPYANDFPVGPADMAEAASLDPERLSGESEIPEDTREYRVAGRVVALARFGKAAFAMIRQQGHELQIYVKKDLLEDATFKAFKKVERGDIIAARGRPFVTRKGKVAIRAEELRILTMVVRPLPEKWHGIKDPELRYRQRYVDMVVTEGVAETFRTRARIVRFIREFLDARGFVEVETPMLHTVVGGAAAKPFCTHHNALDMDITLRIAPELYLKRLVVGGLDRVYEIGRSFRNEGLSRQHNPEFTMLEFYQAYATYDDLMVLTEKLLSALVQEIKGGSTLTYQGQEVDFTAPWPRLTVREATLEGLQQASGEQGFDAPTDADLETDASLSGWVERAGLLGRDEELAETWKATSGWGERLATLFELFGEERLPADRPVFVTDYPSAISPLSRRKDDDPELVDRFELFVCGREIANAFSELNDPEDQRQRFLAQLAAKERGAEETMDYDEDYCRALEYGMPPAAGEGIGIDRLTMFLTDQASIRDVIAFPLLRPERQSAAGAVGAKRTDSDPKGDPGP